MRKTADPNYFPVAICEQQRQHHEEFEAHLQETERHRQEIARLKAELDGKK